MTIPSAADDSAASKCIECSAAISAKAKFCLKCGASQTNVAPTSSKCVSCNAEIPEFAKFCEECGALQTASPPSSPEHVGDAAAPRLLEMSSPGLEDSIASGVAPQPSATPLLSSTRANHTSKASEAASVDSKPSTQKKPFKLFGIAAVVIALACIGAWYLRATQRQKATDNYNLGLAYENGQGVPKDEAQAVSWFRKAAEQGNADAQFRLGSAYVSGQGVPKDDVQALTWFQKAAEQGNASGQACLGLMYNSGLGGLAKDDAQAVSWFRKAAEQGNAPAQVLLGEMYELGLGGLAKDDAQAVSWYQKAVEQGFPKANVAIANFHALQQQEQVGTPIDFASLYAKANGNGLEIGKRYKVSANLYNSGNSSLLFDPDGSPANIGANRDFDDSNQLETVLRMTVNHPQGIQCTVVVSMGHNRRLQIHRAENCY